MLLCLIADLKHLKLHVLLKISAATTFKLQNTNFNIVKTTTNLAGWQFSLCWHLIIKLQNNKVFPWQESPCTIKYYACFLLWVHLYAHVPLLLISNPFNAVIHSALYFYYCWWVLYASLHSVKKSGLASSYYSSREMQSFIYLQCYYEQAPKSNQSLFI